MTTQKKIITAITLAMLSATVAAQDMASEGPKAQRPTAEQRDAARARWESMSEEEREAARAERRDRRSSMSDEERQAARERRRERWEGMSAEERDAARARHRERHAARNGGQRRTLD